MSRKRTSLKRIRKLIKGYINGITSSRELGELVGLSHSRVKVFLRHLRGSQYSFGELSELDDEALSAIIYSSRPGPACSKPMPYYERDAFAGGVLTHAFLNVFDYHRYHFAVGGEIVENASLTRNVALEVSWDEEQGIYIPLDSTGVAILPDPWLRNYGYG
mgnify:FL=1